MRRSVLLAAAATLTSVLAAAPASATTCNLLVDPVGDGRAQAVPSALAPIASSPDLDIVSGDLASGATTVVGVLRLTSLTPDPVTWYGGTQWSLSFRLGATNYAFTARRASNSSTYTARLVGKGGGAGPTTYPALSVDVANGTLTWTSPRTTFPALATPGATFGDIHAGSAVAGTNADAAYTTLTYVDQTPSCVAAA